MSIQTLDSEAMDLIGGFRLSPARNPGNASYPLKTPATGLPKSVNADQLAALLGIQTRTISELVRRGAAVKSGAGRYDLAKSVRAYILDSRGKAKRADLEAEKVRLTKAQADAQELKVQEAQGRLLSSADVERQWSSILRDVRSAVLALPSRVQQRLGHLSAADVSALDLEIRDLLTELAEAPAVNVD